MPLLSRGTQRDKLQAKVDTLGIEPRASRMLSGCDTTTPCAHLLALADVSCLRLLTTPIRFWGHGRHIAQILQSNTKGKAHTGQNGIWLQDCTEVLKNGHTGI